MKRVLKALSIIWLSSVIPLSGLAQEAVPAPKSFDTMIVMDASGSMWGQIDGDHNISIANTVLEDVLKDWDSQAKLGLMAYGHNREGDCSDIETLVPVNADTADAIIKPAEALNAKG